MKKLVALLLTFLCLVSLALPALADIIWEPPETEEETVEQIEEIVPEPEPEDSTPGTAVIVLAVGIVVVAAAVLVWVIVRRRKVVTK